MDIRIRQRLFVLEVKPAQGGASGLRDNMLLMLLMLLLIFITKPQSQFY